MMDPYLRFLLYGLAIVCILIAVVGIVNAIERIATAKYACRQQESIERTQSNHTYQDR